MDSVPAKISYWKRWASVECAFGMGAGIGRTGRIGCTLPNAILDCRSASFLTEHKGNGAPHIHIKVGEDDWCDAVSLGVVNGKDQKGGPFREGQGRALIEMI